MAKEYTRRDVARTALAAAVTAGLPAPAPGRASRNRPQLGLVTYNVAKDWDLATLLRNCKEAGIHGVEFRTTHAHGVEPSLDGAQRKDVRARCADAGMHQLSLGTTCEFEAADAAEVRKNVETCKSFVALARDIGAAGVKVRPNGLPAGAEPQKVFEQIGKALAECGAFGAEHGVQIWMEVHGGPTQMPAAALAIMKACGHPNVGLTWNSNPTDVQNGSVKPAFDMLKPYIRCCHINDLWGSYPYRELFGLLAAQGYGGYTLCEVGSTVRPDDGALFLNCYRGLWEQLNR